MGPAGRDNLVVCVYKMSEYAILSQKYPSGSTFVFGAASQYISRLRRNTGSHSNV